MVSSGPLRRSVRRTRPPPHVYSTGAGGTILFDEDAGGFVSL
jgi:hypothetical protein